ncbi:MAG: S8 family serine peptidase, partial [Cyanobacteria bacterium]|nr:S8 family serine peptidase [Cyanobacteriota bacterium]
MASKLWMGSDPSDDHQSQDQENAFGQKSTDSLSNGFVGGVQSSAGSLLGTSSSLGASTFGSSLASVSVSSIMSQMAAFSAQAAGTGSSLSHSQSSATTANITPASSSTANSSSSGGNPTSSSSNSEFANADLSIAPTDFGQWHLVKGTPSGVDINVQKAWKDYSGKGINVGVVDQGVSRVSELTNAYDPAKGFDVLRRINDGNNKFGDEQHGTWVSGVIAAKNDGQGTTGVAYNSTITSFRFLGKPGESRFGFVSDLDTVIRMQNKVQVSNNSWGFTSPLAANSIAPMINSALESTVRTGRNGLGTIMVFAAGNSRQQGDNTNYSPLTNSRFSIVAAACNPDGTGASFSTMGTNILVTAPGVNIIAPGLNNQYYQVSGTSFAAPIVSAVSALMLEANSKLGYRDVQEILAYSARQNDAGNASWQINGAKNWNGGGLHVSNQYGFGLIDATAAVRLAESWGYTKPAPLTAFNETSFSFSNLTTPKSLGSNQTLTSSINVNKAMKIEHVEVQLNLTQPYSGDLTIRLISPNNTVSLLMDRPALGQSSIPYSPSFTLSSNFDWGETGLGNWSLQVTNAAGGRVGTFSGWSLKLYGDTNLTSTPFIFTDEYGKYTGTQNAARQIISSATGKNIINAAAVTSNNN